MSQRAAHHLPRGRWSRRGLRRFGTGRPWHHRFTHPRLVSQGRVAASKGRCRVGSARRSGGGPDWFRGRGLGGGRRGCSAARRERSFRTAGPGARRCWFRCGCRGIASFGWSSVAGHRPAGGCTFRGQPRASAIRAVASGVHGGRIASRGPARRSSGARPVGAVGNGRSCRRTPVGTLGGGRQRGAHQRQRRTIAHQPFGAAAGTGGQRLGAHPQLLDFIARHPGGAVAADAVVERSVVSAEVVNGSGVAEDRRRIAMRHIIVMRVTIAEPVPMNERVMADPKSEIEPQPD